MSKQVLKHQLVNKEYIPELFEEDVEPVILENHWESKRTREKKIIWL